MSPVRLLTVFQKPKYFTRVVPLGRFLFIAMKTSCRSGLRGKWFEVSTSWSTSTSIYFFFDSTYQNIEKQRLLLLGYSLDFSSRVILQVIVFSYQISCTAPTPRGSLLFCPPSGTTIATTTITGIQLLCVIQFLGHRANVIPVDLYMSCIFWTWDDGFEETRDVSGAGM